MAANEEARRVRDGGTSEVVLWRNVSEVTDSPAIRNQVAWLAARFDIGSSHARLLAQHAFGEVA